MTENNIKLSIEFQSDAVFARNEYETDRKERLEILKSAIKEEKNEKSKSTDHTLTHEWKIDEKETIKTETIRTLREWYLKPSDSTKEETKELLSTGPYYIANEAQRCLEVLRAYRIEELKLEMEYRLKMTAEPMHSRNVHALAKEFSLLEIKELTDYIITEMAKFQRTLIENFRREKNKKSKYRDCEQALITSGAKCLQEYPELEDAIRMAEKSHCLPSYTGAKE